MRARFLLLVLSLASCAFAVPAAHAVSVSVGPRETVYDYDTMRCEDFDWPDIPVRAFRDSLNRIQLVTGQGVRPNRRFIGPDFDNLTRDCTPLMTDSGDPLPSEHNDSEWLSGDLHARRTDGLRAGPQRVPRPRASRVLRRPLRRMPLQLDHVRAVLEQG